jgi:hypothetical protein
MMSDSECSITFTKELNDIIKLYTCLIEAIDKEKMIVYVVYFIVFYFFYYFSIANELNVVPINMDLTKKLGIFISMDVFFIFIAVLFMVMYKRNECDETSFFVKRKNIITVILIFIINILMMFTFVGLSQEITSIPNYFEKLKPGLTSFVNFILIFFFIFFFGVFSYNLIQNKFEKMNVEFWISVMAIFTVFIQNILVVISGLLDINSRLKNEDFSKLPINCLQPNTCNQYSDYIESGNYDVVDNKESFDNNSSSSQLASISSKYGSNYLKTIGNIPISFLNKKINDYQDLTVSDFYYPGSAYTYLSTSPLYGKPDMEAIKIALSLYKCRIIHLDVYSDSSDPYDPNANPIVRCDSMQPGAKALHLEDIFATINKWAWINNDPNNVSYPFFIYLQFKFKLENENMYIKIYNSFIKFFSTYLPDRKYGFAGRNGTFPLSQGKIKDFIGKIILITNNYPTKTILDELINDSTYSLTNTFNLIEYKTQYITFGTSGLSQDYDKTKMLNNCKTNINLFYSKPNKDLQNNNQTKSAIFNPSFQDCAQYGIQATLMNVFIPDTNFKNWYDFFNNVNNKNPVLKDEILRYIKTQVNDVVPQNPLLGLTKPQKYCVSPQMTIEKSNITANPTNTTCDM